jgi:predicted N-acetyltransferase YhbS
MTITLRPGTPDDAERCGQIIFEAFGAIADQHNFPTDFPVPEAGIGVAGMLLSHPGFYCVVAEDDGVIVGSNFLDERGNIVGLGPITVSPNGQNSGVGRQLMQHMLDRAAEKNFGGVRLLQAAYHNRSMALYANLDFDVQEICSVVQGPKVQAPVPGCTVRATTGADLDECNRVCVQVHGHERGGEVSDSIQQGSGLVVERGGKITGYTTGVGFFGHSVGVGNEDIMAMIAATAEYFGPGLIVPTRNTDLLRWCMSNGLRIVQNLTLMTTGFYQEPKGAYLTSILM